jgi:dTDP-4-amino-4,6-dideoxygalactose transaminase
MKAGLLIEGWLREHFPRQPHIYFGLSGATLLSEALQSENRKVVVLSAFLCPSLSLMAQRAGKRTIHVDADPHTLLPDQGQLELCLSRQDPRDTVLLMDHSFGFPFSDLMGIRRRFPDLLVIEDCARALGAQIGGAFPGEYADWVLLSMYKTVRGSQNGGVLLTKNPVEMRNGGRASATLRERAATVPAFRLVYDFLKRARPEFAPRRGGLPAPEWTPAYGLPSEVCMGRFAEELRDFGLRAALRHAIADELSGSVSEIPGIESIRAAPGCRPAGQFVSFRMTSREARDSTLTRLHKRGLFLSRTWDLLPAHYGCFAGTFPWGNAGSRQLGETVAHIPVNLFLSGKARRTVMRTLGELCAARQGKAA